MSNFSRNLLRVLHEWPVGQFRDRIDLEMEGVSLWSKDFKRACDCGYVKRVWGTPNGGAERMDKTPPMPASFRRPGPGSVWPYFVPEHWEVHRKSPVYTTRKNIISLHRGDKRELLWGNKRHLIDSNYPIFNYPRAMDAARKWLFEVLIKERPVLDKSNTLSYTLKACRYMAMLLVQPVLAGDKIVRFETFPEAEQMDRLAATSQKIETQSMHDLVLQELRNGGVPLKEVA